MTLHWFFAISVSHDDCPLFCTISTFEPLVSVSQARTSLRRKYSFVSKSQRKIKLDWVESKFKSSIPLFQEQDEISIMPKSCGWSGWLVIRIEARASRQASLIVDTADINAGDIQVDIETTSCS